MEDESVCKSSSTQANGWTNRKPQAGGLMATFWGHLFQSPEAVHMMKPHVSLRLSLLYPGNRGLQHTPFKIQINNRWKREEKMQRGEFQRKIQKANVSGVRLNSSSRLTVTVMSLFTEQITPALTPTALTPASMHKNLCSWQQTCCLYSCFVLRFLCSVSYFSCKHPDAVVTWSLNSLQISNYAML